MGRPVAPAPPGVSPGKSSSGRKYNEGGVRKEGSSRRHQAQAFMASRVEPLVTELIQNLYLSRTLNDKADVPAAMLSFLRRRGEPVRAAAAGNGATRVAPAPPRTAAPSPRSLEPAPPRSRKSDAVRKATMRELKPILCEMCKQACAERPRDVDQFFVSYLEKRPVFLSPLYHLERFGSMGSFEAPRRVSFDGRERRLRPDAESGEGGGARDAAAATRLPTPRVDVEAHRSKVARLALPAWWLPSNHWKLVWCDDFDVDGPPDPRKWGFQTECNRWIHDDNHSELQHYTSGRRENAWVEGGVLRVTARREKWGDYAYTSARLHTKAKGDWLYGRIEVCARLPPARRGLWPALWLLPTDSVYGRWPKSGEIDLCENIGWHAPGTIHTSVHTAAHNHTDRTHAHRATVVPDAHDKFHVYSLVWRPTELLLCVDGETVHSFQKGEPPVRRATPNAPSDASTDAASAASSTSTREPPVRRDPTDAATDDAGSTSSAANAPDWPFDQRFFLLINLAVGGKWGGKKGVDDEALPASLEIAYVRVFQER